MLQQVWALLLGESVGMLVFPSCRRSGLHGALDAHGMQQRTSWCTSSWFSRSDVGRLATPECAQHAHVHRTDSMRF
jgi:hypothetical protein